MPSSRNLRFRTHQVTLWISILIIGLIVVGLIGFNLILNNYKSLWFSQSQAVTLKLAGNINRHKEKLLMLQRLMNTYLTFEASKITLPKAAPRSREYTIYRQADTNNLKIISPTPLSLEEQVSCGIIAQGVYPYVSHLSKEFGEVARFYIRLNTGQILEYYYGQQLSDSTILKNIRESRQLTRPMQGKKDTVGATPSFIGTILHQQLVTFYTALVFNGAVIGEICLDMNPNYFNSMLQVDMHETKVVLIEASGVVLSSNISELNRDKELINIFSVRPGFPEIMSDSVDKSKLIEEQETRQTYVYMYQMDRNTWIALYMGKSVIHTRIILTLLLFLFAFIALWAASWAFYKQRIITNQLKKPTLALEKAKTEA